ncbi:MAG TPA: universal stress protein [Terriglobia bacterium]|nr:universal stress protein [Terriglobia bacterium]
MMKIERIVCPVDFSEYSTKAYDYAYSLAKHYRAKLFLEHVVQPLQVPYPYYAFPEATVNDVYWNVSGDAEKRLKDLATSRVWNGLQPEWVVQKGFVPDTILEFAEQQSANLIVMGTHGRRGIDRVTMGSVTEKVLRKARCPVLAVRKPAHDFVNPEEGRDPVRLRRILLATDFSDYALRALDYGFSLAMEYNAELTLMHVLEDVPASPDLQTATKEAISRLENPIPQDARNWCSIKSVVRIGKPYQEIIQLALEAQSDLVILGVRGRNALDLALFGSTTHRVIQLGSCPVLAVHV